MKGAYPGYVSKILLAKLLSSLPLEIYEAVLICSSNHADPPGECISKVAHPVSAWMPGYEREMRLGKVLAKYHSQKYDHQNKYRMNQKSDLLTKKVILLC